MLHPDRVSACIAQGQHLDRRRIIVLHSDAVGIRCSEAACICDSSLKGSGFVLLQRCFGVNCPNVSMRVLQGANSSYNVAHVEKALLFEDEDLQDVRMRVTAASGKNSSTGGLPSASGALPSPRHATPYAAAAAGAAPDAVGSTGESSSLIPAGVPQYPATPYSVEWQEQEAEATV
jgi:hypothetical protein